MTVYVDSARNPLGRMLMAHMMGDNEDELHLFAYHLGLRREWYMGDHYDISQSKRSEAIRQGAIATTSRALVELRRSAAMTEREEPPEGYVGDWYGITSERVDVPREEPCQHKLFDDWGRCVGCGKHARDIIADLRAANERLRGKLDVWQDQRPICQQCGRYKNRSIRGWFCPHCEEIVYD